MSDENPRPDDVDQRNEDQDQPEAQPDAERNDPEPSAGGETDRGSEDSQEGGPDREAHPEERGVDEGAKCPECDAPIENVRMSCPNCGREYEDDDYTDEEAGTDFRAGMAVDEKGEEKEVTGDADVDEEGAGGAGGGGEDQDEDTPDATSG